MNNSGYDRWWEARKIWGKLINDSRHFSLKVVSFVSNHWNEELDEQLIKESPDEVGKKDYYVAMTHLLDADLIADTEPEKAMASYLLACENLSNIMTTFPANGRVKSAFVQACIDGAALGDTISNAGNAKYSIAQCMSLFGEMPIEIGAQQLQG